MRFRKLISELSRRNVFKAIIAYLAIAWVVIQIASIVFPTFDAPDYSLKILIYILSVGLILWIGFSWVYDITSDGIKKTEDIVNVKEVSKLTNQRLNKVIAGALTIAVLLLISLSFLAGSLWNDGLQIKDTKKVAVIPFLENAKEQEDYFKTGMTDALIDELSKVDELLVISQASTRLLSEPISLANMFISNETEQIDYFVYGSIEREMNTLNIHIQLKESLQSDPIWAKKYTDDLTKVRNLWANVAKDLTRQMGVIVKPEDAKLWNNLKSVRPETYELYLKGKHFLNKSTPQNWQKGFVYLEEAIDKSPSDSYAYSGLAEGYVTLGHGPAPPSEVFAKAQEAALRSIQLDSTNANGWAALSHYHTYFGWDWELAEYAFNRANDLNPNLAYNHYHRAWYLALFGRMNEAIDEHKRAQELDPFTPQHTVLLGELYRIVGLYEEGLAEIKKVEQMRESNAMGLLIKGKILIGQGKTKPGLETIKQASQINPAWKYLGYGQEVMKSGNTEEGMAIIRELEAMPITPYSAFCLATLYSHKGDLDSAFKWFGFADKFFAYPWIRTTNALTKKVRQDPRFLKLIRDMNLPDPAPLVYEPI
jgi:TolB-like protein/tetratricopeptide (TPR) repeat protein